MKVKVPGTRLKTVGREAITTIQGQDAIKADKDF